MCTLFVVRKGGPCIFRLTISQPMCSLHFIKCIRSKHSYERVKSTHFFFLRHYFHVFRILPIFRTRLISTKNTFRRRRAVCLSRACYDRRRQLAALCMCVCVQNAVKRKSWRLSMCTPTDRQNNSGWGETRARTRRKRYEYVCVWSNVRWFER